MLPAGKLASVIAADLQTLPVVVVGAIVFVVLLLSILFFLLASGDGVLQVRVGFYIDRELEPPPDEADTHVWPNEQAK